MYFLLISLIYTSVAQLSVKGVSEKGFFIHFNEAEKLRGEKMHWVARRSTAVLSVKELMNGVTSLGEGCSGSVGEKQLQKAVRIQVLCPLEFGKPYTFEAIVTKSGQDPQIFSYDFDFSNLRRRRLLDTPSQSPVTSAPTSAPIATSIPSRAPVTRAPTANGVSINPSMSPSSTPSAVPSAIPVFIVTSSAPTTGATIPIMSTSLKLDDEGGKSTFAGFDLSSGGGISLFVFVVILLIGVLILILGGPYIYRRYYETFGSKRLMIQASPKAAAKLSEIWEETITSATKKISDISKGNLCSSFGSASKIEIAPIKSEDKIRLAEPVE